MKNNSISKFDENFHINDRTTVVIKIYSKQKNKKKVIYTQKHNNL